MHYPSRFIEDTAEGRDGWRTTNRDFVHALQRDCFLPAARCRLERFKVTPLKIPSGDHRVPVAAFVARALLEHATIAPSSYTVALAASYQWIAARLAREEPLRRALRASAQLVPPDEIRATLATWVNDNACTDETARAARAAVGDGWRFHFDPFRA